MATAGIEINFEDAFKELDAWVKDVKTSVLKQGVRRALRRTSKTMRSESIKTVRRFRNLKVGELKAKKYMVLTTNLNGKNPFKYWANMYIAPRPIPMLMFVTGNKSPTILKGRTSGRKGVKNRGGPKRKRVRIKVRPGKPRTMKGAWVGRTKSGQVLVLKRETRDEELGVKGQSVPGLSVLFTKPAIKAPLMKKIKTQLQKEVVSNLRFYIDKSIEKANAKIAAKSKIA